MFNTINVTWSARLQALSPQRVSTNFDKVLSLEKKRTSLKLKRDKAGWFAEQNLWNFKAWPGPVVTFDDFGNECDGVAMNPGSYPDRFGKVAMILHTQKSKYSGIFNPTCTVNKLAISTKLVNLGNLLQVKNESVEKSHLLSVS